MKTLTDLSKLKRFDRYKNNLLYDDNFIYSYFTPVCRIDGGLALELRYPHHSNTTSKHINYACIELGLTFIPLDEQRGY